MSADTTNLLDREGAYSMRSVPVRIYLPDGPVIQEVAPPLREDGKFFHILPSFLSEFVYPLLHL
jgi:autophagy-related protein 5